MTETTKSLPEIYREAAELVLAEGKTEGYYVKTNPEHDECFGYCTMGAVFRASGDMTDDYEVTEEFEGSDAQTRLIEPIANQIVASGRRTDIDYGNGNGRAWDIIYLWNDNSKIKPTAEDVAALLRETADAVEVTA